MNKGKDKMDEQTNRTHVVYQFFSIRKWNPIVAATLHCSTESISLLASANKEPHLVISTAAGLNSAPEMSPLTLPRCHVLHVSLHSTLLPV